MNEGMMEMHVSSWSFFAVKSSEFERLQIYYYRLDKSRKLGYIFNYHNFPPSFSCDVMWCRQLLTKFCSSSVFTWDQWSKTSRRVSIIRTSFRFPLLVIQSASESKWMSISFFPPPSKMFSITSWRSWRCFLVVCEVHGCWDTDSITIRFTNIWTQLSK